MPRKDLTLHTEANDLSAALFEPRDARPTAAVLCHGAFGFKENWAELAEYLAERGTAALALDFTGHGGSEGMRGTVDMHVWPYDIRAAIDCLIEREYRRCALVGLGSGATAAILTAAHDGRVSSLVALAPVVHLMPSLGDRVALSGILLFDKAKRAIFGKPLSLSRTRSFDKKRFAVDDDANQAFKSDPAFRELLESAPVGETIHTAWIDITAAAEKVDVPTLIIHGARDAVYGVDQSHRLYDAVAGKKELQIIEETGHALHLDQSRDQVYQLIAQWIARS
jgi:alpha-beta hydrolase superfamily lysophospholipase